MAEAAAAVKITLDDVVQRLINDGMPRACADVIAERSRQLYVKGYTPEHDDQHDQGEIAQAAASLICRAMATRWRLTRDDVAFWVGTAATLWPGDWRLGSARAARDDLIRAAALLIAEFERLDRLSGASTANTATSQTTSQPT